MNVPRSYDVDKNAELVSLLESYAHLFRTLDISVNVQT